MAAESALMEALLRLEHKLDIVLKKLLFEETTKSLSSGYDPPPLPQVGDREFTCPLCQKKVHYILDQFQKVAVRSCACKTGIVPTMDFTYQPPAPPTKEKRNADYGLQEDDEPRRRR